VRKMFAKIVMASVVLLAFSGSSAQSVKTGSDQNVSGKWTLKCRGLCIADDASSRRNATDWHVTTNARAICDIG
jgi:hypothetical protein